MLRRMGLALLLLAAGLSPSWGSEMEEALKTLREGGPEARQRAAALLGEIGDASAVKPLVLALRDAHVLVREEAQSSLLKIWHRSGDKETDGILHLGIELMGAGELQAAINAFTRVIERAPNFAEGYNKRATALYLAGEYERSIADCETTLRLNPYHFGALFGEGLNYIRLDNLPKALEMFRRTLEVLPYSESSKAFIEAIEKRLGRKPTEL